VANDEKSIVRNAWIDSDLLGDLKKASRICLAFVERHLLWWKCGSKRDLREYLYDLQPLPTILSDLLVLNENPINIVKVDRRAGDRT
jgi:hypothetical protein